MSQENVAQAVVRKPLRVRERSSRSFDQRLALYFARLTDRYSRLIAKLPPTARVRQAATGRAAQQAVEAWNRRDLDALLIGYHPDCQHHPAREFVEAGLWEPSYRGREGIAKLMASWAEAGTDARLEPTEFIDLGPRVVLLYALTMRTSRLGDAPLTRPYASVLTLEDGKILRIDEYCDHAEALESVGLRE
jgi:ketosteroid isomerase-like protein